MTTRKDYFSDSLVCQILEAKTEQCNKWIHGCICSGCWVLLCLLVNSSATGDHTENCVMDFVLLLASNGLCGKLIFLQESAAEKNQPAIPTQTFS